MWFFMVFTFVEISTYHINRNMNWSYSYLINYHNNELVHDREKQMLCLR